MTEEQRAQFDQSFIRISHEIQGLRLKVIEAWKDEAMALFDALSKRNIFGAAAYIKQHPPSAEAIAFLVIVTRDRAKSAQGKPGADALHNKPGGSREKKTTIQAAWASGKYSSRAICAEQECAASGMSLSTAGKALRNTPDPEPWPGKKKREKRT